MAQKQQQKKQKKLFTQCEEKNAIFFLEINKIIKPRLQTYLFCSYKAKPEI